MTAHLTRGVPNRSRLPLVSQAVHRAKLTDSVHWPLPRLLDTTGGARGQTQASGHDSGWQYDMFGTKSPW